MRDFSSRLERQLTRSPGSRTHWRRRPRAPILGLQSGTGPYIGYKNHLGIDRRHGFIRRFAVTDAATHDDHQLVKLLDPDNTASAVWADSAYRSAANVALLARRRLVPQFPRPKPRGQPMPRQLARGNASRARVRVAVEHVFPAQKCGLGLVIRSIGLARAKTRLGLANWSPTWAAWSGSRPAPHRPEAPGFRPTRDPRRAPTSAFHQQPSAAILQSHAPSKPVESTYRDSVRARRRPACTFARRTPADAPGSQ